LTLPVCENDGRVCGVVDVMDLIYGCGGADGWRSIFDSAMDIEGDERSETQTHYSTNASLLKCTISPIPNLNNECLNSEVISFPSIPHVEDIIPRAIGDIATPLVIRANPDAPMVNGNPNNIPSQVLFDNEIGRDSYSLNDSLIDKSIMLSNNNDKPQTDDLILFKVVDNDGHIYRIRSINSLKNLLDALIEKVDTKLDQSSIKLKFVDDEGDEILISSDACLNEAVCLSQRSEKQAVKITMVLDSCTSKSNLTDNNMIIIGSIGAVLVSVIAIIVLRPKKY